MNLVNFATLGLFVTALGFLLLGLFVGFQVVVGESREVLEVNPAPEDIPPHIVTAQRTATGLVTAVFLFSMFSVPAFFLTTAGLAVWHCVGYPRFSQQKREGLLQPVRETILQDLLSEIVQNILRSEQPAKGFLRYGLKQVLPNLGSQHRARLCQFVAESAVDDQIVMIQAGEDPTELTPPSKLIILASRASALLFFLVSTLFALWGIVVLIPFPLYEAYGQSLDAKQGLATAIALFLVATLPAALGIGFLGFSHADKKVLQCWQQCRSEAEAILLTRHHQQMTQLVEGGLAEGSPLLPVARALTTAGFAGLEARGRETLEKNLHALDLAYVRGG